MSEKSINKYNINFCFFIYIFLQANFFTWFKIAGVMPNMFVILVLFIGLYAHKYMGVTYGIIFGFLIDLFISKKVGISAIMLGAIGIMGTILDKNFSKENRITIILITTIATVLFEVGSQILSIFVYKNNIQVLPLFFKCFWKSSTISGDTHENR